MPTEYADLQPFILTVDEVEALLSHSHIDPVDAPEAFALKEAVRRRMETAQQWDEPPSLKDVRERLSSVSSFTDTLASAAQKMPLETNDQEPAVVLNACRRLREQLHPATLLLIRSCGVLHELMPDLPEWEENDDG